MGIILSKVRMRGVWRLQAPQRWQTFRRAPRWHRQCCPYNHLFGPGSFLSRWPTTRNQGLVSANCHSSSRSLSQRCASSSSYATCSGATARAGSIEMVSPSASQVPAHRAAADRSRRGPERVVARHRLPGEIYAISEAKMLRKLFKTSVIDSLVRSLMLWRCHLHGSTFAPAPLVATFVDAQASVLAAQDGCKLSAECGAISV